MLLADVPQKMLAFYGSNFKPEFYVSKVAKVCYRDVNFHRHNTCKITVQKYIVEGNVEFH